MGPTAGAGNEDCPSDETLAAFLDGRASRRERRKLTAHLDSCARCRTVFTYSAQYQSGAHAAVHDAVKRRWLDLFSWSPPRYAFAGGIALAVALALGVAILASRDSLRALGELSTETAASALFSTPAPSPSTYSERRWRLESNTFLFASGPTESQRAFLIGVHLVDLRVGLEEDRGADASASLRALRSLCRDADGGALFSERWASLEGGLSPGAPFDGLVSELSLLEAELDAELDPVALDFGRWTEAGRLAAATGNVAYFDEDFFRRALRDLADRELAPLVLEEVRAIRALTPPASSDALDELESRFRQLILLH